MADPERSVPDLTPLADVMARLRDPERGCAWDVAQDFASVAPYTIEEAYEVADAVARHDMPALRDELGDLLLQVVFHSRMAEERGAFTLTDVIAGITAKMIRRHPHVFTAPDRMSPGWEEIKAGERRASGDGGALDGVAQALPALMRAQKIQKRVARVGFDWSEVEAVRAKVVEEMDELAEAADAGDADAVEDEAGDLLFALVNLVRHHGVDAEVALCRATAKFEARFRLMEAVAGAGLADLSLADKEALWADAKVALRATRSA